MNEEEKSTKKTDDDETTDCWAVVSSKNNTVNDVKEPEKSDIGSLASDEESGILDFLGPMIINTDGTINRISNWTSMTDAEQASARRLIAARNKKRKQVLLDDLESK